MFPQYWIDFLEREGLVNRDVEIPEDRDLSGFGADMRFCTSNESIDEAENYQPGITVAPLGYVPVGHCLFGSGDPYFINSNDGKNGALYRVCHEYADQEPLNMERLVELVLKNYEDALLYLRPNSE
jgi:hypothetical protein